jgi:DNA-binding NarL/FixJ family response regulator
MSAFRILIADDHYLVRQGLRSVIALRNDWEVCGEAVDGREAVQKCAQLKPDLLILDICLPKLNGLDAARQILTANPAQKILIVTDIDSHDIIRDCVSAGVRGWVWKNDGVADLLSAVDELRKSRTFFTSRVSELILSGYLRKTHLFPANNNTETLSAREREVLQLVCEGNTSKEVAVILHLSAKTAETHRTNVLRKLKLHSTVQLVLYAVRNNIVQGQRPALVLTNTESARCVVPLTSRQDSGAIN